LERHITKVVMNMETKNLAHVTITTNCEVARICEKNDGRECFAKPITYKFFFVTLFFSLPISFLLAIHILLFPDISPYCLIPFGLILKVSVC
jgi:hypothetical protein